MHACIHSLTVQISGIVKGKIEYSLLMHACSHVQWNLFTTVRTHGTGILFGCYIRRWPARFRLTRVKSC